MHLSCSYAPFFSADLIIGSPLGLRSLLADESGGKPSRKGGAGGKQADSQRRNADWLSSIEVTLVRARARASCHVALRAVRLGR